MKNEALKSSSPRLDLDTALSIANVIKPQIDGRTSVQEELMLAQSSHGFKNFFAKSNLKSTLIYLDQGIDSAQKKVEEDYETYSRLEESELAKGFIESIASRARTAKINNPTLAEELEQFLAKSPNEKISREKPSLLASVVESIALKHVSTDPNSKVTFRLSGGSPVYDWNPLSDIIEGEEYHKSKGVEDPDTAVIRDIFRLLGWEKSINLIPDMPNFRRGLPKRDHLNTWIDELGVDLNFTLEGPTERGAEELRYIPGSIKLQISKQPKGFVGHNPNI
jgi:hypothetical protein